MTHHPAQPTALGVEAIAMTKRFGDFVALDDVSLKVTPGSFHALLGENGAGKSTLVKCVMGYYQPDAGEVVVGGRQRDIGNPRAAHALGLGMVYQHFTLVPAMTVAENLVLARDHLPPVIDWRNEIRDLENFLERMPFRVPLTAKVSAISAGERQKCEILKQLYLRRRFLILDEPTSGLDPLVRREFLESMVDVAAAGRTVLLSSHQIGEVERVADIVVIIKQGKLLAIEKLDDLKHHTRELTLTLNNGAPYLSDVPGEVICGREHERQWRLLVRHLDETRLESFRSLAQVRDLEVRTPNLEEIFVGYMRSDDEPRKEISR